MKKLALSAVFLMVLFGSAVAHNGALSLYKSATLAVCSAPIGSFETDTIGLYYVRGSGPELGTSVEFRLETSNEDALIMGYDENSQFAFTFGDISTSIAFVSSQCLGVSQSVVYIASIWVFYSGFDSPGPTFTVMVKEGYGGAVYITLCLPNDPPFAVLGGTFVYNGSCNPAVKETSWGAIKELYR